MAIANQITIYLKYNRVQTSHEIHRTICRKVLDKTFDLEFFNCIHTVLYSKISRFIGDFASHCLSMVVYLSTVVSYLLYIIKKKHLYCFWGIYPPYPLLRVLPWGLVHTNARFDPVKNGFWILDSAVHENVYLKNLNQCYALIPSF